MKGGIGSGVYFPMTNCCSASLTCGGFRLFSLVTVTVSKLMSCTAFQHPSPAPRPPQGSCRLRKPELLPCKRHPPTPPSHPANLSRFFTPTPTAPFVGQPRPTLPSEVISPHPSVCMLSLSPECLLSVLACSLPDSEGKYSVSRISTALSV